MDLDNPFATTLDAGDDQQTQQAPATAAPSTPAPKNEFVDTLDAQDAGRSTALRTSMVNAAPIDPEKAAQAQAMAPVLGVPASVILRNFDAMKTRALASGQPWYTMAKQSPITAAAASDPTQPARAAAMQDDLQHLGFLEWMLKAPKRALDQHAAESRMLALRYESLFRPLTADEQTQLDQAKQDAQNSSQFGAEDSWFRKAIVGTVSAIPDLWGATWQGIKYGVPTAAAGGGLGLLGGPFAELTVPAGMTGGFESGFLAGNATYMFRLEAAKAYDDYLNFRDEHGQPIDPAVARAAAFATGAINGGLQSIGAEYLLKSMPGLDRLSGALTRSAVKQALRMPTIRAALLDAAGSYGKTLGVQTGVQTAVKAVSILGSELTKIAAPDAAVPGQLAPGNVNLFEQPAVRNADGTVSTVDSVSINEGGREILLPRVTPDGRHLTTPEAVAEYHRTGRNLGVFQDAASADAFAEQLHKDYAAGVYGTAAGGAQPFNRNQTITPDDAATQLLTAGKDALTNFAILSLPGPFSSFIHDALAARRAEGNVAYFKALGDGVSNSKTVARVPDTARTILGQSAVEGGIKDVYAPVDTWSTYWQGKGVDPREVATTVTGDPEAFDAAIRTGTDLKIPTERYATTLAGTEHNDFFANELRLAPDEMNAREAAAFQESLKTAQPEAPVDEQATAREQVRKTVAEKLVAAGYPQQTADTYASLYDAAFGTLAARAGVSPLELFSRYGLEVRRAEPDASPAVPDSGAPAAGDQAGAVEPVTPEQLQRFVQGARERFPALTSLQAHIAPEAGAVARPGDILLSSLAVRAGEEGTGVGSAVMRELTALADQGGHRIVTQPAEQGFQATPESATTDAARLDSFYRRHGFQPVEGHDALATSGVLAREPATLGRGGSGPLEARAGEHVPGGGRQPALALEPGRGPGPRARRGTSEGGVAALPASERQHFDGLLAGARAHGFTGTDDELADLYSDQLDQAHHIARDIAGNDVTERDLLEAIQRAGGLGVEAEAGGMRREVESLLEALTKRGTTMTRKGRRDMPAAFTRSGGLPGLPGIVKRAGGRSIDNILENLAEDPRFEHRYEGDAAAFLEDVRNAIDLETGFRRRPMTKGADIPGILENLLAVKADAPWWVDNFAPQEGDEPGSEFNQGGLFDELATDAGRVSDLLSTGEEQPRLPGDVGAVRDQEVPQPQLGTVEDKFELTPPKLKPEIQKTLFQGERPAPSPEYVAARDKFQAAEDAYSAWIRANRRLIDGTKKQRASIAAEFDRQVAGIQAARDEFEQAYNAEEQRVAEAGRPPEPEQTTLFQGTKRLIIQHNTTADKLRHADKMGGLPVPSMAIAHAEDPLTNFGDITLLGSREMANPRGYARTRVFGADVYSPRYPRVDFIFDKAGRKVLGDFFKENGRSYYDLDQVQTEGVGYLRNEPAVISGFLKSKGIEVEGQATGEDTYDYRRRLLQQVDRLKESDPAAGQQLDQFAKALFDRAKPTEKIYKGFTNQGNRSYRPHTLENVVKEMKRNIRGGETDGNIFGTGQLRAKFAPEFRSLEHISKARDLIVDDATFDRVKKEVETDLFKISDALKASYDHGDADRFGFVDTVMAVMEDAPKKGLDFALKDYGFSDVPAAVKQQIGEFLTRLRNMPTEYFEAKILREVDLAEFAGAVVPDNTPEDVRNILAARGVKTVDYPAGDVEARKQAIGAMAHGFGDAVLFQDRQRARRGYITFGTNRQFTIGLLPHADLSTFLHETGHFYLEVLGDLDKAVSAIPEAERTPEHVGLLKDAAAVREWLGATPGEAFTEAQHEQFARGFERYLMEGEAPSLPLRTAFAKFRAWLIGVYRNVKALGVELTPQVRAVFDRLLASDQAIGQAEEQGRVAPMFLDARTAGMSPEEFQVYSNAVADASRMAREQMDAKLLSDVNREQTRLWKEQRADVEAGVRKQVEARPEFQALAALQKGTRPDGSPLLEGGDAVTRIKLDRKAIVDRYGKDRLQALPRPYVYSTRDGVDPDIVADMFGYRSGDELTRALAGAGKIEDVIKRETDQAMIAQHGSTLLDGHVYDRAQAAVANAAREQVLKAELRALVKLQRIGRPAFAAGKAVEAREREYERRWFEAEAKLRIAIAEGHKQVEIDKLEEEVSALKAKARGGARVIAAAIPSDELLRANADDKVAAMRIHDLQPAVYWSAARRGSRDAVAHAARQDFDAAIQAKQNELLNLHLFRAVSDAREDVDARVADMRDLAGNRNRRARIAKAGDTFLEQVDALLGRYNFAPEPRRLTDLRRWVAAMEGEGLPVDLPADVVDQIRRVPFTEMTYDELTGVTDGIRQLVHLAQLRARMLKDQAAAELKDATDAVSGSIRGHKGKIEQADRDRNRRTERFRLVDSYFASHRKIASLARQMDGGQDGGAVWEHIIRPLNEAANDEAVRMAAATKAMGALVEDAYPGREKSKLYDRTFLPGVNRNLSKMERLMIALNWGNEGNRQRIRSSEKWSDAQVKTILDTLDARDWKFVQGVWDHIDSYWPEIAAKQKRVTGIEPLKVDAAPIDTVFGPQRGGYFPLKYDDRLSPRAAANLDLEGANIQKAAAYVSSTTRRGHTQERLSRVTLPVRLDFGVIFEHLNQVIHDLSHHETLIDVQRVLASRDVQQAMYEHYGDVVYDQFKSALRDIAVGGTPGGRPTPFESSLNYLRKGVTLSRLGWNVTTALLHPSGLTRAAVRIGPTWVVKGLSRWLRDAASMENTVKWITEKSSFMDLRGRTQEREIAEIRSQVVDASGKLTGWIDEALRAVSGDHLTKADIADSYFWLIKQGQRVADVPTWIGAYEKAMADPKHADLTPEELESRSIALADQAVLDAESGGQIKDLAAIQRGAPALKVWTMFYSLFSATHNLAAESVARTNFKSPRSVGRLASDFLMLYTIPAAMGFYARSALVGGPQEAEDPKKLAAALAREQVAYIADTMIGVRELSGPIRGQDYSGPAGASAFVDLARLGKQAGQGEADAAFWRALNDAAGVLFQYPSTQVWRVLEGWAAMEEGEKNPGVLLQGSPKAGAGSR